jgi:hypothetical protein
MAAEILVIGSVPPQIAAAILALRLIQITGARVAWGRATEAELQVENEWRAVTLRSISDALRRLEAEAGSMESAEPGTEKP